MVSHTLSWFIFSFLVLGLLALDLSLFEKRPHKISSKEALCWSLFWIFLALAFNLYVYFTDGTTVALQFFTGYLLEKSLSVDNLFIFVLIFSAFKVPMQYQHKILYWGIVGALVMRLVFILAGSALLMRFEWVIYVFGGFLAITGIKLLIQKEQKISTKKSRVIQLFKKFFPVTDTMHGDKFFFRGKATPLFLVLLVVETTDLIFALDSIPAIFAITSDPFIVYTSNIFAILGLRALYFLLAGYMEKLRYLRVGLALILIGIGIKMGLSSIYSIPIGISLGAIALILTISVVSSLYITERGT